MSSENNESSKVNLHELNVSNDINSLWVNGDGRVPTESEWFIGYIRGVRVPLKYNVHNRFWVDNSGKTYKPNEIDKWLNA